MKLVLYGDPHCKFHEAIFAMCRSKGIDIEHTKDFERVKRCDYDILYSTNNIFSPDLIDENIKIIFGPQLWVFPEPPFVGPFDEKNKKRCVYNCLSKWVEDYCKEFSDSFAHDFYAFPFSVNFEKFSPAFPPVHPTQRIDCILYSKLRAVAYLEATVRILQEKGIVYRIFKYGSYKEQDYLENLRKAKFMLTLDRHESQGYALQEAMATGVPLLVFESKDMYEEKPDGVNSIYEKYRIEGKKLLSTCVPYWDDEMCGIKIDDFDDMPSAIDKMMVEYTKFNPREYIVKTLSPEKCMDKILDYFGLQAP